MRRWRERPCLGREVGRRPRNRSGHRTDHPRRDRRGHEPLPDPRTPGVLAQVVSPHEPVRREEHRGPGRAGQSLAQGRPQRGRQCRRPHRHLSRRPLPAHRQTPWPRQSPGSRLTLDTRHCLAPDQRTGRLLPGTRLRLAPTPPPARPATSSASSRPSATRSPSSPRPPDRPHSRHPVRKRPGSCRLPSRTSIFRSASESSQGSAGLVGGPLPVRGHPRAFQSVQWWRDCAVRVETMWSGARDSTVCRDQCGDDGPLGSAVPAKPAQ